MRAELSGMGLVKKTPEASLSLLPHEGTRRNQPPGRWPSLNYAGTSLSYVRFLTSRIVSNTFLLLRSQPACNFLS